MNNQRPVVRVSPWKRLGAVTLERRRSQRASNNRKRRERRDNRDRKCLSMALVSGSLLETFVFIIGSSSESSRASLGPSLGDNSTSSTWVAEMGIKEGVTSNEDPPLTTCEMAAKGSLAKTTGEGGDKRSSLGLGHHKRNISL